MKSCVFYIILMLVIITSASDMGAQKKNVDAAWRLVGKTESVGEARKLIQEAMKHEQTDSQARTYFVAAMIEWRSYEADVRKREINPKDTSVTDASMTAKLLDGYRYLRMALPLDSLPDKKGRVKPKYSREIHTYLDSHAYDLYRAGAISYSTGKYYPEAYSGFMAAADLSGNPAMINSHKLINDSLRANTYFYAGLSAYGGKQPVRALRAFEKAEIEGFTTDTLYLYSMAIWEQLARDSAQIRHQAQDSLLAISTRAYQRHGIKVPEFLSRMTQIYIAQGQTEHILPILNAEIAKSPDEWLPRGLRGWVYESTGDTDAAIKDYKLAAEHPEMSTKMLMRGAHALYRTAHARKNDIKGTRAVRRKMADELLENYLNPAASMARRAREKATDTKDIELINNILDAIDYDSSLLK